MQEDREEERGNMPVPEDAGEEGLGTKSGGIGGPDDSERQEGGVGEGAEGSGSGDEAITGPTKNADSVPGGGSEDGPSPGGVPQEGGVNPDADTSTGST